jgi:hypothetical protein
MNKHLLLPLLVLLTLATAAPTQTRIPAFDVVIYGGTSAGVIAAVQAARMGKSVALLEPGQYLGGMSVEGLGGTDIDNHKEYQNSPAVGGLALEFYRRVSRKYGREEAFDQMLAARGKQSSLWRFEPHVAEAVFNEFVKEHNIAVLLAHRLAEKNGVTKDKQTKRITSLRCTNGAHIRGQMFIDATYEGDLLAVAGVTTVVGREGNAKYGETKNGIRTNTTHSQLDRRIDPYRIPGNPSSGTIYAVSAEPLGEHGAPSDAIQGFSFRLCLTKNPANRLPIEKPAAYDASLYELQRRYLAAGGVITAPVSSIPNGKTDPGSWHPLAGFLAGWNHNWNTANYAERARMLRRSREYVQGLLWFLAHDEAVPEMLRAEWAAWGLCKDEFTDNGGWPRMFYVRNGRRMVSDFVMTEAHGRKGNPVAVADPIGLIWWPQDLHNTRRLAKNGAVWNEGAVFNEQEDWIRFGHSYRSLIPRASECTNLLAPTCPSMSYVAYGAFRLEFSFMIAAQSAATAACIALDDKASVQNVNYAKLRTRLLQDKQVLEIPR